LDEAHPPPSGRAPAPARTHSGPPSKLARNVVVGTLITFVVASNLGNLFLPVLVTDRPLLFIGLNAQNRNLALASGELEGWSFYLVGFLRLVGPDPFFFLLGRWYGDAAIRWMERRAPAYGELLRQLETWFSKAKFVVVAIAPNNPVCLFAGAAGMSVGLFALANVLGTAARLVLIRSFSELFEGPLGSLRGFIGEYRFPLLAVSFLLVGLTIWSDRRRGRDGIGDLAHLEEDIAEHESPDQAPTRDE
jgi:membrane protein DedA with SNARE-associated domain